MKFSKTNYPICERDIFFTVLNELAWSFTFIHLNCSQILFRKRLPLFYKKKKKNYRLTLLLWFIQFCITKATLGDGREGRYEASESALDNSSAISDTALELEDSGWMSPLSSLTPEDEGKK